MNKRIFWGGALLLVVASFLGVFLWGKVLFPQTEYQKATTDFVYAYDWGWNQGGVSPYQVLNGTVNFHATSTPNLWIFRAKEAQSSSISLDEVQQLRLAAEPTSPDGYVFVSSYEPCHGDAQCPHWYLKNVSSGQQIDLFLPSLEFIGGPHFVGWVIP